MRKVAIGRGSRMGTAWRYQLQGRRRVNHSRLDEMGVKSTYDQMEDNANTRLCVGEKAWDSVDGHET